MIRVQHLFKIILLSLLLFACQSSTITTPEKTLFPTLPNPSQSPAFTETGVVSPSPTASPGFPLTSTPPLPVFTIIPTTRQHPGSWNFQLPLSDPQHPQRIVLASDGYQLDPSFQIASIELSYRWIGIGEPVRIYQRVERRDDSYWRGDSQVPAEAIQALLESISHLHPQPCSLSATTHTDDYPFWAIELTDLNGDTVLLYSESNSPGFVPWNVISSGEIYAQFEALIATALPELFEIVPGETLASVDLPGQTPGFLTVVSTKNPAELLYGFTGLLPIYNALSYQADKQSGELRGRLGTLSWDEKPGNLISGSIVDLQEIELEIAGRPVSCALERRPGPNPESLAWDFACPVGAAEAGDAYRYPISVTFTTSTNQVHTLSGELFGYWETGFPLPAVPYPEEIGMILETSPVGRDLLRDHQVQVLSSIAAADLEQGRLDFNWKAGLVLLGQVQLGARLLPYTVSFQVGVEDAKLTHWDLERTELRALLEDVLSQAITRRFLEMDPDLVLNLYYGEVSEYPLVSGENLQVCAGLPLAAQLPSPGYPLRGFSFNHSWEVYAPQILLIGEDLRINHLDIEPASPEDAIWFTLLPAELKPPGGPPLRLVFKRPMTVGIGLYWEESASPAAVERYKAIFESWDVPMENKEAGVFIDQVMFDISPEGQLALVFCQER